MPLGAINSLGKGHLKDFFLHSQTVILLRLKNRLRMYPLGTCQKFAKTFFLPVTQANCIL